MKGGSGLGQGQRRRQSLSRGGGHYYRDVHWVTASPGPAGQAPCSLHPGALPPGEGPGAWDDFICLVKVSCISPLL